MSLLKNLNRSGLRTSVSMNIFFLSMNPEVAAKWHCDKHVVKMIVESTQLLWTAQHVAGFSGFSGPGSPYRPTHKNHPCAVWARASIANYKWLCALATALVAEYHYRFPAGKVIHACEPHLAWLTANPPRLPEGPLTWPALAMPPVYKISKNPTACYRAYYLGDKQHILRFTRRERPCWISTV
jgi:hypothetical protein